MARGPQAAHGWINSAFQRESFFLGSSQKRKFVPYLVLNSSILTEKQFYFVIQIKYFLGTLYRIFCQI